MEAVDDTLSHECPRWATTDGEEDESEASTVLKANDCAMAGEWFRAFSFQSTLSTMLVVRENIAVHPITAEQLRTRHRLPLLGFSESLGRG